MATVTKPIALDESFNTTELTPRNLADVIAEGIGDLVSAISQIAPQTTYDELDKLNDVQITSVSSGQVLKWNGSKWVNANESGGSGGHTIEDSSGTAMTQRTNLQFKGVRTSDESGNDRTVVDATNETIDWTDWDAMSSAQQEAYLLAHPNLTILNAPDYYDSYTYASKCMLSDGVTSVEDKLDGNTWDIEYTATANMTFSQVATWLYNNVDKSKINANSKIYVAAIIFSISIYSSTEFTMFTIGTMPTGIYVRTMGIYSTPRAFTSNLLTSGTTTTDNLSQTMINSGSKIKVKY